MMLRFVLPSLYAAFENLGVRVVWSVVGEIFRHFRDPGPASVKYKLAVGLLLGGVVGSSATLFFQNQYVKSANELARLADEKAQQNKSWAHDATTKLGTQVATLDKQIRKDELEIAGLRSANALLRKQIKTYRTTESKRKTAEEAARRKMIARMRLAKAENPILRYLQTDGYGDYEISETTPTAILHNKYSIIARPGGPQASGIQCTVVVRDLEDAAAQTPSVVETFYSGESDRLSMGGNSVRLMLESVNDGFGGLFGGDNCVFKDLSNQR